MTQRSESVTPTDDNFGQYLIRFLCDQQQKKANVNMTITGGCYDGVIHLREGEIVSATAGSLTGNGAMMTLALLDTAELASSLDSSTIVKTVYITPAQVAKLVAAVKSGPASDQFGKEEQLLEEAKQLFFQYRYKEAGERLAAILKINRFYYPGWLWQSRIFRKPELILKAIDEAYRWGNHDSDIWREARKLRPQLAASNAENTQRCFFCWSLVDESGQCTYCQTRHVITSLGRSDKVREEDIKQTLGEFERVSKIAPENSRVAYSLAIGYFNLGLTDKALLPLQTAVRLTPGSIMFKKSYNALGTLLQAVKAKRQTVATASGAGPAQSGKTVLVVDDSNTARKALAMQFNQAGHQIVEASSGEDALRVGRIQNFDLIVVDYMLPDTNGNELLAQLRTIDHLKNVPVIMLTGKNDKEAVTQDRNSTVNEYLIKPFDPGHFAALVGKYLQPAPKVAGAAAPAATALATPAAKAVPASGGPAVARASQPAAMPSAPDIAAAVAAKAAGVDKHSVFVIEDSPTARKVISMVLGRNNIKVVEATTGSEALALAEQIQPGLVLLDLMLPDMTGYDLLPMLRAIPHYSELPIVILTGKTGATDRMRSILVGINEYLTKPFNPEKLIAVIRRYI